MWQAHGPPAGKTSLKHTSPGFALSETDTSFQNRPTAKDLNKLFREAEIQDKTERIELALEKTEPIILPVSMSIPQTYLVPTLCLPLPPSFGLKKACNGTEKSCKGKWAVLPPCLLTHPMTISQRISAVEGSTPSKVWSSVVWFPGFNLGNDWAPETTWLTWTKLKEHDP